jgi:hypothetical protein
MTANVDRLVGILCLSGRRIDVNVDLWDVSAARVGSMMGPGSRTHLALGIASTWAAKTLRFAGDTRLLHPV